MEDDCKNAEGLLQVRSNSFIDGSVAGTSAEPSSRDNVEEKRLKVSMS